MQLTRAGKVALTLGMLQFGAGAVEVLLQITRDLKAVPFGLPLGGHLGRFLLKVREFTFQFFQPVTAGQIILFLQRLGLDLQLKDLAIQLVQFFGLGVHFHPQAAGGFVHQVDGLVGQKAVGDIAVR